MAKKRRPRPESPKPVSKNPAFSWARLVRLLLVCGIIAYLVYQQQQEHRQAPAPLPERPAVKTEFEKPSPRSEIVFPADEDTTSDDVGDSIPATRTPLATAELQTIVDDVTIRSQEGRVVYRGQVDLSETIQRIQRGEKLPEFRHDGITFGNRERRLPQKRSGYYHEWVHPTPKVSGPGPQRIVTGAEGEFWYTPDHYGSFVSLNRDSGNE